MKKEKRVELNTKAILDAARKLFCERGADRTTMDDIAGAADCSKATVYVYFENKDDIYYRIALESVTELRDAVKSNFAGTTQYGKAYFSLCETLVCFRKEHPAYYRCVSGGIDTPQADALPSLRAIFDMGEEINSILCYYISKAKADGFFRRDVDPLKSALTLWTGICSLVSLCEEKKSYLEGKVGSTDEFLRYGFEQLLRSLK